MSDAELLKNVLMSTDPCPICVDAADQEPMTYDDWADSEWGLPGSDARYCGDHCHCVLVPEDVLDEFPAISDLAVLRGETGSELKAIVDVGPREEGLKAVMDEWNASYGKLPDEIYDMELDEIEPYLRARMKERSGS